MTKADKVLIGIILALSLLTWLGLTYWHREAGKLTGEISAGDRSIAQFNLSQTAAPRTIKVTGPLGTSVVEIRAGAVRMKSSPCPDHFCMHTGWISQPGRVIVCVPNRIIIETNRKPDSVDAIAY